MDDAYMGIADVVRPAVDRDQCGARGEILFQFGDVLEKAFPKVRVQRDIAGVDLLSFVTGLKVADEHCLLKKNALQILAGKPVLERVM